MAASEALVFDAIRTPRGKGKVNGSLHATKPVDLVVGLMHEMLARNAELDPERVDDVVLGCVSPVGDQGMDIAKTAALKAGLPDSVPGVQLNRFCASGLEAVNVAAQKVFLFVGTSDSTVGPNPMNAVKTQYTNNGVPASNLDYLQRAGTAHVFPTDFDATGDNACGTTASPYIANCGYDGAGLQKILGEAKYARFADTGFGGMWLGGLYSAIFRRRGMAPGKYFKEWLNEQLAASPLARELGKTELTFA